MKLIQEKKITLKDVAKAAGTSYVTVSRVLNNKPGTFPVSIQTRQKVLDCAKKLHYRPNAIARAMRMSRTGIIGFVYSREIAIHFGDDTYYMGVQGGAEDCLADNGMNLLTCIVDKNRQQLSRLPNSILEGLCDGVLVFELNDPDIFESLDRLGIPSIAVNCSQDEKHNFVIHDDVYAANLLLGHLSALGHKHICVISTFEDVFTCKLKVKSLMTKAKEMLSGDVFSFEARSFSEEAGKLAVEFLKANPQITCFCCVTDGMAVSVVSALRNAGLDVPKDVSVTGMGGHNYWLLRYCDLATVRFDGIELGRMAVEGLLGSISNGHTKKLHRYQKGEFIQGKTIFKALQREK